jgi:hypothetical protein
MKVSLVTVFLVAALALAIWFLFYFLSAPLTSPETMVVVGISGVVVLFAKWTLAKIARRGEKNEKDT